MTMMGFSQRSSMVLGTSEVVGADLRSSDENHRSRSELRVLLSNWEPLVICLYIRCESWQRIRGVWNRVFYKRILWCSQGGDHPETLLPNTIFMPDMKVEKNQNPCIFLATYWNLLQKSGDLNFLMFEIWWIWTNFPMKKSFVLVEIHIFQVEFLLKFACKKNTRLIST
jgi:hypothetical protein